MAEHGKNVWFTMKNLLRVMLLTLFVSLMFTTSASANRFGRMFDNLPGFTAPTQQDILDLALADKDPQLPPENLNEPSGMTYLGQFADHDLTLDEVPQPDHQINPTTIPNHRSLAFDLDSVFGRGPKRSPKY